MARLGLNAYRFSISWPRILPNGQSTANSAGLDFYQRLVDGLLEKGIRPFLTLYHWDLPQSLQDSGGWTNRATAERFAEYASLIARRLGDRVEDWITINEPTSIALSGHFLGEHAPGLQDPLSALQAAVNVLVAHGLAVQALRSSLPSHSRIGIALNPNPTSPASESAEDHRAANIIDALLNRLFLDPILLGSFPAELIELFGPLLQLPDPQDQALIALPLDFLGLNYYTRVIIKHDPNVPIIQASQVFPPGSEYSQMWEIFPRGLYTLLTHIWNEYGSRLSHPLQIHLTENGIPVADAPDLDGEVRDYRRIRYLRDHLIELHQAIEAGVPVCSYFAWSLLDNFEWAHGYQMRFGLVHVDFKTLERKLKNSAHWYAQVIREKGFYVSNTGLPFFPV
jgi:beta-glucosidase